jgi:hypothetical protein
MEVRIGVEIFWSKTFLKFHITIWSCMKFEDVLEVLPMLMLESFLYWFIFIWGHEQFSKMFGEISPRSHYYLKDLKHVYYVCYGKDYGKGIKHCWLMMNPTRRFGIWNGLVFFLNHSGNRCCQRIRCNGWTCHLVCAPLVGLPLAKTVRIHYDFMVKYFKPCLSSSSKKYSWFLYYMYNDNVDFTISNPF